jgi:hypothetical protein
MSVTKHHGTGVALMPEPIDPDERVWIWFCWRRATDSSEWVLPEGWQVLNQIHDATIVSRDDGKTYEHCNGVLASPNPGQGRYLVTNRVLLGDELKDRTVQVRVSVL